jgi:hypothetical protein
LVHPELFATACQYETGFSQYIAKIAGMRILNTACTMSTTSLKFLPVLGEFVIKSEIFLSIMQGKY